MTSAPSNVSNQPGGTAENLLSLFVIGLMRIPFTLGIVCCCALVGLEGCSKSAPTVEGKKAFDQRVVRSSATESDQHILVPSQGHLVPLDPLVSSDGKTIAKPKTQGEGHKIHKYRILPDAIEDFAHEHFLLWNFILFGAGFLITYFR